MDAYVSDVVVVLDKAYEGRLDEAVRQLEDVGLDVKNTDDENEVVEGTIEVSRLAPLEKLACVDYVRKIFTYAANYPPGDPRDVDRQ